MTTTRGIRKVNENILAQGRAFIVTEKDKDKYKWSEIPNGSKFIDTQTGIEMVKLEGQSDWVPAGIKQDGTLNVIKDSLVAVETFVIKQLEVPNKPGEFIYLYGMVDDVAHTRHGRILYKNAMGQYGEYGQYGVFSSWADCKRYLSIEDETKETKYKNIEKVGYVFSLEKGDYGMMRNHLEVAIDDVLLRNSITGGLKEVSETRFCLTESNLEDGMKVSAKYVKAFRLGNPYPRTFENDNEPSVAEIGDFWLDIDGTLDDADPLGDKIEQDGKISWNKIRPETRPTTITGYGIQDKLSYEGHTHRVKDIVDFPKTMPANGGHAETANTANKAINADRADTATKSTVADRATADGAGRKIYDTYLTKSEAALTYVTPAQLGSSDLANKVKNIQTRLAYITIGPNQPSDRVNGQSIWFCTAAGQSSIRVYYGNKWVTLGAAWES